MNDILHLRVALRPLYIGGHTHTPTHTERGKPPFGLVKPIIVISFKQTGVHV